MSTIRPPISFMTILFIDGDDHAREYYAQRMRLSWPDARVIQAATGREGLSLWRSENIDCVVTEIALPDMSGFEVLRTVIPLAKQPKMAIIVLTELTNHYLIELALRNGAQAVLRKTLTADDLLASTVLNAVAKVPGISKSYPSAA